MLLTVFEKMSARIDQERWLILTNLGQFRWQVQLWGPEPMQTDFVGLTMQEAKEYASALASLFLMNQRSNCEVPSNVEWKVLVSRTERQYKFQSA
jgi:hypothetical protein